MTRIIIPVTGILLTAKERIFPFLGNIICHKKNQEHLYFLSNSSHSCGTNMTRKFLPVVCSFVCLSVVILFSLEHSMHLKEGVCLKFQGCLEVLRMFQGSFKGINRKFQGCFKEVQRVFQESSKGNQVRLKGILTLSAMGEGGGSN